LHVWNINFILPNGTGLSLQLIKFFTFLTSLSKIIQIYDQTIDLTI
jgi:hypothetical protein